MMSDDHSCRRLEPRLLASLRVATLCLALGCANGPRATLPLSLASFGPVPLRSVELRQVGMARDASSTEAVGTQRTGGFGARDLAALEASLRATLATIAWPQSLPAARRLQLDVGLGRYLAIYTKSDGAVLACVHWLLSDGEAAVVHRAQFYVAESGDSVRRAIVRGDLKQRIEAAIVERISKNVLLVASAPPGFEIHPISVARTYASLAEAAAGLPASFDAVAPKGSHARREIDWALEGRCSDG